VEKAHVFDPENVGSSFDPARLLVAIDQLRDETCVLAGNVGAAQSTRYRNGGASRAVRRWLWGLGGLAVVALNHSPLAAFVGLPGDYAPVSDALGGAITSRGVG
jgi:hypothetical protein